MVSAAYNFQICRSTHAKLLATCLAMQKLPQAETSCGRTEPVQLVGLCNSFLKDPCALLGSDQQNVCVGRVHRQLTDLGIA